MTQRVKSASDFYTAGGGVTGMTAALEVAAAGYPAHLVCDEGELGGAWKDLYKRVPFRAAASEVPNGRDVDLPLPEEPSTITSHKAAAKAHAMCLPIPKASARR